MNGACIATASGRPYFRSSQAWATHAALEEFGSVHVTRSLQLLPLKPGLAPLLRRLAPLLTVQCLPQDWARQRFIYGSAPPAALTRATSLSRPCSWKLRHCSCAAGCCRVLCLALQGVWGWPHCYPLPLPRLARSGNPPHHPAPAATRPPAGRHRGPTGWPSCGALLCWHRAHWSLPGESMALTRAAAAKYGCLGTSGPGRQVSR